jgi:hypothetical protein
LRPVGDHFCTTSASERDTAVASVGYVSEDMAATYWSRLRLGPRPLTASSTSATATTLHHLGAPERDTAVANFGYVFKGVAVGCKLTPHRCSFAHALRDGT